MRSPKKVWYVCGWEKLVLGSWPPPQPPPSKSGHGFTGQSSKYERNLQVIETCLKGLLRLFKHPNLHIKTKDVLQTPSFLHARHIATYVPPPPQPPPWVGVLGIQMTQQLPLATKNPRTVAITIYSPCWHSSLKNTNWISAPHVNVLVRTSNGKKVQITSSFSQDASGTKDLHDTRFGFSDTILQVKGKSHKASCLGFKKISTVQISTSSTITESKWSWSAVISELSRFQHFLSCTSTCSQCKQNNVWYVI